VKAHFHCNEQLERPGQSRPVISFRRHLAIVSPRNATQARFDKAGKTALSSRNKTMANK